MPPSPVKSAVRALDVLELLAAEPQPPTHGEMARHLAMPKSSLTELLATLERRGYVTAEGGRYRLGPALLALAGTLIRRTDVARIAQPVVASLMLRTGESTALVLRQGDDVVVICKENCDQPILYSRQLGQRGPINASAGGKAIMAFAPEEEREAWLRSGALQRVTPHSVTDPQALRRELAAVAAGGIAYSREEMVPGIVAMGLPVFDAQGRACAGLSVGIPMVRFDPAREARVAQALRVSAAEISAALGWQHRRAAE
ncbi:IclR family transcriptional regulator [Falsiroseomonas oryzae]|uniref:IclR family transcriptional regulator n=1 Tax=Falsiroseomonas oryzae TaxID=2766473 RepID=UPI0022EB7E29|nr:IclR family transcriptional regulator [Roseomonas sp. MO-31]